MSHLPFACNWQNRFFDSELVIAHFLSNKGGTSDIRILRNFTELHLAPCMHDMCSVCGLGLSLMSKQNVVSYLFDFVSKAHESKEGHL